MADVAAFFQGPKSAIQKKPAKVNIASLFKRIDKASQIEVCCRFLSVRVLIFVEMIDKLKQFSLLFASLDEIIFDRFQVLV